MRVFLHVAGVAALSVFSIAQLAAQIAKPVVPLSLNDDAKQVQIPAYSILATPQCDSSGTLYIRYSQPNDESFPSTLAKVADDGSTQTVPAAALKKSSGSNQVLGFAASDGDSLHQVVRIADDSGRANTGDEIQYVTFDSDGSLRSHAAFEQEFIPSMFLPLPSGKFFAAGVVVKRRGGDLVEVPQAGIFNGDAQLERAVQNKEDGLVNVSLKSDTAENAEPAFDGGIPRLGGDGHIYILLSGNQANVAVLSQAAVVLRQMKLQAPFDNAAAQQMFVSGSRLLVIFEGESAKGESETLYVTYDAQAGDVIRQYRPEFSGTPACFQDGRTLTVLVRRPSSGKLEMATAELE